VPKIKSGTDDPRNGLTLCRAHHWAFDTGLVTLTKDYTVEVSPLVQRADSRKFELLSLAGQALHQPQREVVLPHAAALAWHASRNTSTARNKKTSEVSNVHHASSVLRSTL